MIQKIMMLACMLLPSLGMARIQEHNPEIIVAAANNNVSEIERLVLEENVNINSINEAGKTALVVASEFGNKQAVRVLVQYGADPDIHIIGTPSYCNDPELPNEPKMCFDVLPGSPIPFKKDEEWTALHFTADRGYRDIAELLLKKARATVDARDSYGRTPLMIASRNGNVEMINLLIRFGADVTAQSDKDYTALYYALANRRLEEDVLIATVKILKNNGASVNDEMVRLAEKRDSKALMKALTSGHRRSILRMFGA